MILFFDRSMGTRIPKALRFLKPPVEIRFHDEEFKKDEHDDIWLPKVGRDGWIVISQDYSFHTNASELEAIKQYQIGCFYLWGATAPKWETFRILARAFDRVLSKAEHTPKPFIFRVHRTSQLTSIELF